MSYELFISLRHLRSRKTQKFISLITIISIGGVALGVMALIIVIAVMSGFGKDLRDKIIGTNSHIVITSFDRSGIRAHKEIVSDVKSMDHITGAAPFILKQVMLVHGGTVSGVVVRGIESKTNGSVSDLEQNLVEGKLEYLNSKGKQIPGEPGQPSILISRDGIILGNELARSLGVASGDIVSMVSPAGRITPLGIIPHMKMFQVVGVFESGMYEYDSNLAFISISAAQKFFVMKNSVTGVEIKVDDIEIAGTVAIEIQEKLGYPYYTRDWMRMNKNLFSALKLEKIVMFIILVLIILVAAFNIISTLFMVVMEKNRDIAILKSMGASRKSIMKIFSLHGLIIGLTGTTIGCVFGFSIVPYINEIVGFIEGIFGIKAFPSDVYYLDRLPAEIQYMDSILIIIFSIVICFAASLYPAWRASRLDPVDGLRYE